MYRCVCGTQVCNACMHAGIHIGVSDIVMLTLEAMRSSFWPIQLKWKLTISLSGDLIGNSGWRLSVCPMYVYYTLQTLFNSLFLHFPPLHTLLVNTLDVVVCAFSRITSFTCRDTFVIIEISWPTKTHTHTPTNMRRCMPSLCVLTWLQVFSISNLYVWVQEHM